MKILLKEISTVENFKIREIYINDIFFCNSHELLIDNNSIRSYKNKLVNGKYILRYDFLARNRQFGYWLKSIADLSGICQHSLYFRFEVDTFLKFGLSVKNNWLASHKYYLRLFKRKIDNCMFVNERIYVTIE